MSSATIYELVGYAASILVVVSLAMSSVIRLRIINLIGASVFIVYGALIESLPILATNVVIVGLDVMYLARDLRTREELDVFPVAASDHALAAFVRTYRSDIERFYPAFDDTWLGRDTVYLLMRDANIAGFFVGERIDSGTMRVDVDYVAKPYRDFKSGVALYADDAARFRDAGVRRLITTDVHPKTRDYLTRMGFTDTGDGTWVRELVRR